MICEPILIEIVIQGLQDILQSHALCDFGLPMSYCYFHVSVLVGYSRSELNELAILIPIPPNIHHDYLNCDILTQLKYETLKPF